MNHPSLELFTESAWGGLPPGPRRAEAVQGPEPAAAASATTGRSSANPHRSPTVAGATVVHLTCSEPPEFVETLGFPRGTPRQLLAQVLRDIRDTPPGARVQRLLAPGVLSPLFSQSAAEASYALAVLSVVESPGFEDTLARLQSD